MENYAKIQIYSSITNAKKQAESALFIPKAAALCTAGQKQQHWNKPGRSAHVNAFAVLHWITASRFTKRTTNYSSLIRSSSSTTAYRFLQLKPKTGGNSWFESYKQKHPQLLRSFTPNNCSAVYQNLLVLFLIQASHQPLLIASYTWSRGPPDAIKNYITLP